MRKHDARMIIQKFIGRTFRGTRKDHPQHHLYWCKREPIGQRRKIEIEFWTGWYLSLHSGYFREQVFKEAEEREKPEWQKKRI